MVQTRLVNIETGSNAEHRFRSEDKVERARSRSTASSTATGPATTSIS
jgi:translation elongation factor P/translation initiation factor 5A